MSTVPPTPNKTFADTLMKLVWRKPPTSLAEQARRRVTVYLIPYLFFLYILAYLDRVNVSVAKLGLTRSPEEGGFGWENDVIGFGFGLFFWGYWILEVPSTLSVLRWGARYVFVRILILWGVCCTLLGAMGAPWLDWMGTPETQFYVFRFLLGFFEGGFFPSVILYLSLWFRPADRAKAIAAFMAAIPVASLLGSPLSGWMLSLDWLGLHGWRWIFILQGVAPILAGFMTLFFLPNRPKDAHWLPDDEKAELIADLDREAAGMPHGHGFAALLAHWPAVLLLTATYFCLNVTSYGLSSFLPTIFKSFLLTIFGIEGEPTPAQLDMVNSYASWMAALPFSFALLAMLINGWHSDRTKERVGHVAVPLMCLSLALLITAMISNQPILSLIAVTVLVGSFMYSHLPAFWPIPTMFLGSAAAASAIGFINMIGNLGGSVGPWMFGELAKKDETVWQAILALAPFPLASSLIVLSVSYLRSHRKQPDKEPPLMTPDVAKLD